MDWLGVVDPAGDRILPWHRAADASLEPALEAFGAAGTACGANVTGTLRWAIRFTVCSSRLFLVAVTKDHFQPVQLPFDLIRAERDIRPLFVGDDQAISLRNVDALNLQTTLKNLR